MDFPAWKTNNQGSIKEICDKWSTIKAVDKEIICLLQDKNKGASSEMIK